MRAWGVVALAMLLGACVPSVVSRSPGPPPRPAPARPSPATGGAVSPIVSRTPLSGPMLVASPAPPAPADAVTAAQAGLMAGPSIATLPITPRAAADALIAFRTSCPGLVRRADSSGLTRGDDWRPACDAAMTTAPGDAQAFFVRWFETVQVGDGAAFATGYYEPEIRGAREPSQGYSAPIYGKPQDLIEVDLGLFSNDLKGKRIRGRVEGQSFVPYWDRAAIAAGALAGRGLEIAWAADPVELFFLQVQGSGRLRLPGGDVMRIGYAGQNGRDYTAIGALMRDRGLLQPGQASMQGIMAWLRAHPDEGRALMNENKSFVFFRELTGPGPLGAMGVPVTGELSAAADPRFVPLGAPVFLSLDRPDASGLWVVQDTGGAIKGANRFDTFWGAGDRARGIAGGLSTRGVAFLLLPAGTLARLTGQ